MSRRSPVLALAAGAFLGAPATSHALAGSTDRSCYTRIPASVNSPGGSQPVNVSVTGGTPGASFQVIATVPGSGPGSGGSATGTFDAAGNGVATIQGVASRGIGPNKGRRLDLAVRDFGSGTEVPIGSIRVTNLALAVRSKPSNPRAKRLVRVSGGPFARKRVFGFITNNRGTKVLKRITLGKADACGFVKRKAVVAPSPFRYGRFRLFVKAGKRFNRAQSIGSSFTITRTTF